MPTYESLIALENIDGLASHDALGAIAALIDQSERPDREEGTAKGLAWCDALETRGVSGEFQAVLDYYRANAWANRMRVSHADRARAWSWEQPEIAKQILLLRKSRNNPAFQQLPVELRCRILTNLANQFSAVGRTIEAIEVWTRAVRTEANFWMAQGNRGLGLARYAKATHDSNHRAALALVAHDDLRTAIANAKQFPTRGPKEAIAAFKKEHTAIERAIDIARAREVIDLDGYDLGRSALERGYRQWCLQNRLFLNPLNDLGSHTVAAADVLTLPDFVAPVGEPPALTGFFNQLKQEFVSARWLYYEGYQATTPHFSDRNVVLFNTLDYPVYCLAIEKIKFALRTAYSLFDKTAFFLNSYLELGVKPTAVSFKRIWQGTSTKKGSIAPTFEKSENLAFRGLYWQSLDITDEAFSKSPEPDARDLDQLRNHLEHKYLKVVENFSLRTEEAKNGNLPKDDDLAFLISRDDLMAKGLRILKLARATLIYLTLGMHREEQRRSKDRTSKPFPMSLGSWDYNWKR